MGLLAVSMARMESMTSGRQSPLDRYWLTMLVVIILLVMGAGLLVMDAFTAAEAGGDSVMAVLTVIAGFVGNIIVLLLTPFGYLAYWLILLLERLVGRREQSVAPIDLAPPAPTREQDLQAPAAALHRGADPAGAAHGHPADRGRVAAGQGLNRRRGAVDEEAEEVRESAGSLRDFWGDIVGFFRRLLGLAGGRARRGLDAVASALRARATRDPALTVRQIYARLLHLAASRGAAAPGGADRLRVPARPARRRAHRRRRRRGDHRDLRAGAIQLHAAGLPRQVAETRRPGTGSRKDCRKAVSGRRPAPACAAGRRSLPPIEESYLKTESIAGIDWAAVDRPRADPGAWRNRAPAASSGTSSPRCRAAPATSWAAP